MAYTGRTYLIDCSQGGLTGNNNPDVVGSYMMVHPTRNINIHNGGREKRGGTAHVNSSAIPDTPDCMGGFDFTMASGTQFILWAGADGKLYKNDADTIGTGLSTSTFYNFCQAADKVFIANSSNKPQVWDGTGNVSEIDHPATDFTAYPVRQMLVHGYGNSERVWALNRLGVYASLTTDFEDFSDGTVINIPIETGDGNGLQGMVEFGDRLVVFGKSRSYIIDDSSSTTSDWGYSSAIWEGGAASWRLIVRTPNDIVCMSDDGEIYSVSTAEQYGDYKQASLTRPAWVHAWIREYLDLSKIDQFHAVYDPNLRAIRFFVVRSGQSTVDTCLLYFIDRGPTQGWVVHDNNSYASGYSACSSWLVRASAGVLKIYTGDYDGFKWELETATLADNGNGYYAGFTTPYMPFDNGQNVMSRYNKMYNKLGVVMLPKGNFDLSIKIYIDGVYKETKSVNMGVTGSIFGTDTWGSAVFRGVDLMDETTGLGYVGKRTRLEVFNSNANQGFFVSQLLVDFKNKGSIQ